jgi:hypothetical protein
MDSPSTCPLHPIPIFHTKFFFPNFFFLSIYFYDSLLFHKSGFFYKTSFQFFLSFWEHVKTWIRQWVIPLHVPYTHPPFFTPKKYYYFLFSSFFIFMIPYSSTNPAFFTKLHFEFFLSFWEHFKTWGGKLDVLKVLPAKAKKHRVRNRWRSDVDMVRWLRRHMAHLNVGPCPKASR